MEGEGDSKYWGFHKVIIDLGTYHNIDAEKELTEMLSRELKKEIDKSVEEARKNSIDESIKTLIIRVDKNIGQNGNAYMNKVIAEYTIKNLNKLVGLLMERIVKRHC